MSTPQREKLTADTKCMEACVSALDTLGKHHHRNESDGDSVAEAQAKQAQARVLGWLLSYYGYQAK